MDKTELFPNLRENRLFTQIKVAALVDLRNVSKIKFCKNEKLILLSTLLFTWSFV
jgi:hypothetical protein